MDAIGLDPIFWLVAACLGLLGLVYLVSLCLVVKKPLAEFPKGLLAEIVHRLGLNKKVCLQSP